jgi:hypothetical protein
MSSRDRSAAAADGGGGAAADLGKKDLACFGFGWKAEGRPSEGPSAAAEAESMGGAKKPVLGAGPLPVEELG